MNITVTRRFPPPYAIAEQEFALDATVTLLVQIIVPGWFGRQKLKTIRLPAFPADALIGSAQWSRRPRVLHVRAGYFSTLHGLSKLDEALEALVHEQSKHVYRGDYLDTVDCGDIELMIPDAIDEQGYITQTIVDVQTVYPVIRDLSVTDDQPCPLYFPNQTPEDELLPLIGDGTVLKGDTLYIKRDEFEVEDYEGYEHGTRAPNKINDEPWNDENPIDAPPRPWVRLPFSKFKLALEKSASNRQTIVEKISRKLGKYGVLPLD